jgi:carotenoid cleavage dioxygenase
VTREEALGDAVSEFPVVNGRFAGRRHRLAWAMTAKPGWFLFDGVVRLDVAGGAPQQFRCDDGVYLSEAHIAPRVGGTREDDGWLVTITTDVARDASEVWIFDPADIAAGPQTRLALPERVCHGTHACWAPASALARPRSGVA